KVIGGEADENCSRTQKVNDPQQNFGQLCRTAFAELIESNDRPDMLNFRFLLWKCIEKLSDVAESKTRYLSPVLLRIMEKELIMLDKSMAETEDIRVHHMAETVDADHAVEKVKPESALKLRGGLVLRTLITCLNVYSKFRHAESVAKSEFLKTWYHKLLTNSQPIVQKAALSCVLSYRDSDLENYREFLFNILDDQSFNDQLIMFCIDPVLTKIPTEQRMKLMPLLLRILYGRMIGRKGALERRDKIFRFLIGLEQAEMRMFLAIVFAPLQRFLSDDVSVAACLVSVEDACNFAAFIPLRKLTGIVETLSAVLKRMSVQVSFFRKSLFKLCLILYTLPTWILSRKEGASLNAVAFARHIRLSAQRRIVEHSTFQYFNAFNWMPLDMDETASLFKLVIWPQLGVCNFFDNKNNPGTLWNLFMTWSNSTIFWHMLDQEEPDSKISPLSALFTILDDQETSINSQNIILKIVNNLLLLMNNDRLSNDSVNSQRGIVPTSEIGKMLLRYGNRLAMFLYQRQKTKRTVDEMDLFILSHLCKQSVTDQPLQQMFVTLLLSLIFKKHLPEASEQDILCTILSLLRLLPEPSAYSSYVFPLFARLKFRASRALLCEILNVVYPKKEREDVREIVIGLNSWDKSNVEEPDYRRRLNSHNAANSLLNTVDDADFSDFCRLLFYNCVHLLEAGIDMSLRDNACFSMQKTVETIRVRLNFEDSSKLLRRCILPKLCCLLTSKSDIVRCSGLQVLRSCVLNFSTHPKLISLSQLISEDDTEADFFENLRHIQLHRRARALRRLSEKMLNKPTDFRRIPAETLRCFVLPVVVPLLTDPAFVKNTALIDEIVKFLGCYCSVASWKKYLALLKHYLRQKGLEAIQAKLRIRILVSILDSFHFKLKNCDSSEQPDSSSLYSDKEREVLDSIRGLLPSLINYFSRAGSHDFAHKLSQEAKYADEALAVARIPVAMALVNLLTKLPESFLSDNLSRINFKIYNMLKSRSWEVRETSRKTLCSIARSVGATYLSSMVKDLRSVLIRGYQLHVLTYTIYTLLTSVAMELKPGDLDGCLRDICAICNEELFGELSEEKSVEKITRTVREARESKSAVTYAVLGRFIMQDDLKSIVEPLKEILKSRHDTKTVNVVYAALHQFVDGVIMNQALSIEALLIFSHQMLSEGLQLLNESPRSNNHANDGEIRPVIISTYIVPAEPRRTGEIPKQSIKTSLHVLVRFALEIFHLTYRKKNLQKTETMYLAMLDPFVSLFVDGLRSKYPNVATAVQVVTVTVLSVDYYEFNDDQLQLLLRYAEEDLYESQRQASAFSLIKVRLFFSLSQI
ncbi:unnamed protein product, partial [Soboliphyme baturini]|uniref:DRIM domain-containing protein n=1 Tax=Soboliphyme baturini TaxID=241478 RepID=A0A183ILN7_9BILA